MNDPARPPSRPPAAPAPLDVSGDEPPARAQALRRLFASSDGLVEALVAAEILAPPLALREGSTPGGRRAF